jgi:hypothetical protein
MNNAQCALRLEVTFLALSDEYGDDPCEVLIDLLADTRHWCDSTGRNFDDLDAQACRHYLAETNEERNHTRE